MQARINGRRAAPPRPTLLVGDLLDCRSAFERLQQRVLELSLAQQAMVEDSAEGSRSVDAWRDLVPRCRALRETLTSLRELSHFTREVYEAAADVCIRAQDWPEALKALQQLVHLIYPALAAQEQLLLDAEQRSAAGTAPLAAQQQGQHSAAAAGGPQGPPLHGRLAAASAAPGAAGPARLQGSGGGAASWASSGTSGGDAEEDEWEALSVGLAALDDAALSAALQRRPFRRWPEVAATLALYFSCVQQGPGADRLDVLSTLRRLPRPLLRSGEVQAALRLRSALGAGDWVGLFRLCPAAPPLVQQLVAGACWARAREQALAAMAAAYRNIAVAAACRQLALDSRGLMACLKLLADRGHAAAQRGLGGLQMEDAPAAADLVFKG